jgi:hypothetical protein
LGTTLWWEWGVVVTALSAVIARAPGRTATTIAAAAVATRCP